MSQLQKVRKSFAITFLSLIAIFSLIGTVFGAGALLNSLGVGVVNAGADGSSASCGGQDFYIHFWANDAASNFYKNPNPVQAKTLRLGSSADFDNDLAARNARLYIPSGMTYFGRSTDVINLTSFPPKKISGRVTDFAGNYGNIAVKYDISTDKNNTNWKSFDQMTSIGSASDFKTYDAGLSNNVGSMKISAKCNNGAEYSKYLRWGNDASYNITTSGLSVSPNSVSYNVGDNTSTKQIFYKATFNVTPQFNGFLRCNLYRDINARNSEKVDGTTVETSLKTSNQFVMDGSVSITQDKFNNTSNATLYAFCGLIENGKESDSNYMPVGLTRLGSVVKMQITSTTTVPTQTPTTSPTQTPTTTTTPTVTTTPIIPGGGNGIYMDLILTSSASSVTNGNVQGQRVIYYNIMFSSKGIGQSNVSCNLYRTVSGNESDVVNYRPAGSTPNSYMSYTQETPTTSRTVSHGANITVDDNSFKDANGKYTGVNLYVVCTITSNNGSYIIPVGIISRENAVIMRLQS